MQRMFFFGLYRGTQTMGILSAVTALTFARALDAAVEMASPTLKARRKRVSDVYMLKSVGDAQQEPRNDATCTESRQRLSQGEQHSPDALSAEGLPTRER
ncbi:hypothetical protein MC885_017687 [Smutsia gigantea]|nr:hypothetical protein MC885_017687 [Smutsia gigantea]